MCDTVQNVCEAEDAIWDINRLEGCAPCPCEELVLQVLCEAMEVVIYCEQALRSKKGVSPGKRCCRKQFREQLIAKYSSFQKALELLDRAIDDAASLWPNSLKYSAVRAMCVQLPARVFACVNAILRVAEEGILEEPIMASIC